MIKFIMSRKLNERGLIGIVLCILMGILGQIILNHISTTIEPAIGDTIFIVIGSVFKYTSILGVIVIIKYIYDAKKLKERRGRRRKDHKLHYLKSNQNQKKES